MNTSPVEIRTFLAGLVGRGPKTTRIPPLLYKIAASALRVSLRQNLDQIQELVACLLTSLWERRETAASIDHLLDLDDRQLLAAVRLRLKHLALEAMGPRWRWYKNLHEHVQRALVLPPLVAEALPVSITSSEGRTQFRLAHLANCHLASGPNPVPRSASALTSALMDLYFPVVNVEVESSDAVLTYNPEPDHIAAIDVASVGEQVRHHLGHELSKAMALRARGATLDTIAAKTGGGSVSMTHARVSAGIVKLRRLVQAKGLSPASVGPALRDLG